MRRIVVASPVLGIVPSPTLKPACAERLWESILDRALAPEIRLGYEGSEWNLNEYVSNSPILNSDPSGRSVAGRILADCFDCIIHPFGLGPIIIGRMAGSATQDGLDAANDAYPPGSVEHRAMPHCVASGVLATKPFVGCKAAECIGTAREDAQNDESGQNPREGQRGKNNNRIGRGCAGCTGGNTDASPNNRIPNTSLADIIACCRNAVDGGRADLESSETKKQGRM